jgi:hypothetical protein
MKLGIRAARDETATKRIVAAADELAKRLGIDTSKLDALDMVNGPVELRGLFHREAVADLLDEVLAVLPAPKKATAKTTAKKKAAAK